MRLLVTATFPHQNNFAQDSVQMGVAVDTPPTFIPSLDKGQITLHLGTFIGALGPYLSSTLSRAANGVIMRGYDITGKLDGSPHGSPVFEDTKTLPAAAGSGNAPSEVAAVLSLRAYTNSTLPPVEAPDGPDLDLKPDRPRQRRTGRIYIGPLRLGNAMGEDVQGEVRVDGTFRTSILAAAEVFADNLQLNGHTWCVWSRKNAALYAVQEVVMDNALDTQRRRGVKATSKAVRTFSA